MAAIGTTSAALAVSTSENYANTITYRIGGLDPTGAADSYAAAQAAMDALPAPVNNASVQTSNSTVASIPAGIYALSDTLKLHNGCTYDLRGVYFKPHSSFTGNKPLVECGSTSTTLRVYRGRILGGLHVFQSLDWTTSRIGIRLANAQEWDIDGISVDGFPIGLELYADTQGCQYNNLKLEKIYNCYVGLKNTHLNLGWANEFTIYGGHFGYGAGTPSTGTGITTPNSRPIHVWARGCDKWTFINTAFETRNPREVAWGVTTDAFVIEQGGYALAPAAIFFLNCRYEVAPASGSVLTSDYMAGTFALGASRCMLLGCSTGHITVTDNSAQTGNAANIDAKHPGYWNGSLSLTPFTNLKTPLSIFGVASQSAVLLNIVGGNSTPFTVNGNGRMVAGTASLPSGITIQGGSLAIQLRAAVDGNPVVHEFDNVAGTEIASFSVNTSATQENLSIRNKSSQANSGIRFLTGATPTERARFDVNGNFGVGAAATAPTSTLFVDGSQAGSIVAISTATTLGAAHSTVLVSTSFTLTLPSAVTCKGRTYYIKKTDATTTVTIATTSAQTIDGAAGSAFNMTAQWSLLVVQSDGANWIKRN